MATNPIFGSELGGISGRSCHSNPAFGPRRSQMLGHSLQEFLVSVPISSSLVKEVQKIF